MIILPSGLTEASVARMPSLPFLTATPRQLGPQIVQAGRELPFTVSDRLEKPLIGMDAVVQTGGGGLTVAFLTALGDLFLQPFETVDKEEFTVDGNHCYSAMHSEVGCCLQYYIFPHELKYLFHHVLQFFCGKFSSSSFFVVIYRTDSILYILEDFLFLVSGKVEQERREIRAAMGG